MNNTTHHQHIEARHEKWVPWEVSDVFFSYVFVFTVSMVFAGILLNLGTDINMNLFLVVLQIAISFLTLGIVYYVVTKRYSVPFTEAFGISTSKISSSVSLGILITAIIVLVTTLISVIFAQFAGRDPSNPYLNVPQEQIKWLTILAVFFAPVVEEIFFRGFMQPAISKVTGPSIGILLTAVLFGLSHTQYLDHGIALLSVTVIGLILGIAKYKTGSVMPGIFAHLFNNLLAVINMVT